MQEDQRQLRRRIHKLEEQLTWNNNASPLSPAISISRTSGTTSTSVPAMIVTETTKARDCFYLADCEGMSDSEYGQYYYNFEDDDDDDDTDDDE
jgi:DNA-directed RNA polymerase specialized sigma24 family protein